MSQDNEHQDDNGQDTPLMRDLRKQLKEAQKRADEAEARAAEVAKANRQRSVADALAAKGVNAKVAKFVPADLEDTPEAIDSWLAENADVFGITVDEPDPEASTAQRINSADRGSRAPDNREAEILRRIAEAKSPEDLLAIR